MIFFLDKKVRGKFEIRPKVLGILLKEKKFEEDLGLNLKLGV